MIIQKLAARGFSKDAYRPRKEPVAGIVIHTTGSGPWRRWKGGGAGFETPFDASIYVYTKLTDYSGHLLVCGETGKVAQLAPFDVCASHVGSEGGYKYKWPAWPRLNRDTKWWRERWPELRSPKELMGGRAWAPSPNAVTVGIEVSPPLAGPREPWSDACWESLSWLSVHLSKLFDIPMSGYYFVGHSDIHPMSRSSSKGPWDPGAAQFDPTRDMDRLFTPWAVRDV